MVGDTGVRSDRFAIKDSVFFKMPISVPTFEEQYKVGDFLNEADHLLTLNQRYYLKIINARTEREIDSREVLLDLPEMEY